MGLIREPLDVDFYFDPRPITKEEERLIQEAIRKNQMELDKAKSTTPTARRVPTLRRKKVLA